MESVARAEARMVLDATFSEGGEVRLRSGKGLEFAVDLLCETHGGVTWWNTTGCWKHPSSGTHIWDTSVTFASALPVETLAAKHKAWGDFKAAAVILAWPQETVYVVDPYGYAEILPVPKVLVERGVSETSRTLPTGCSGSLEDAGLPCEPRTPAMPPSTRNWKVDDVMGPMPVENIDKPIFEYSDCAAAVLDGVPCNDPAASPSEKAVFRIIAMIVGGMLAFLSWVGIHGGGF